MNFLAHLYLAAPADDALVGNFLGDFVKGPLAEAPDRYRRGIEMHRAVDTFTDDHPVHARARARIEGPRRRVAGIIVDLCFDHFLAREWDDRRDEPLEDFSRRFYGLLEEREDHLPERVLRAMPHMTRENWLLGYREPQGIARALDGLSRRRRRLGVLEGSGEELLRHYDGLRADFEAFFPLLETFVVERRRALPDQ